jgi:hypothetical protein
MLSFFSRLLVGFDDLTQLPRARDPAVGIAHDVVGIGDQLEDLVTIAFEVAVTPKVTVL